jgi:transcriptional regulator with XRE-family HTH domain
MRIRLKELMQARGLTAAQVAEATGLNVATVYHLREKPVRRLDEKTLNVLSSTFEVASLDQLVEMGWNHAKTNS